MTKRDLPKPFREFEKALAWLMVFLLPSVASMIVGILVPNERLGWIFILLSLLFYVMAWTQKNHVKEKMIIWVKWKSEHPGWEYYNTWDEK